ncbi:alpha,alpha-phosphotrehalase [Arthrobacter sp. JZ12]|uniref:alpha-glucosidase n=1 Tax=Arthrobacter sp. JZ12 TaxID=2654190 RepID=UPI002B462D19|nr:alpha-glucosidase [Arthrobacter sp. JZ12]WRH25304.1 alpha,alpha-phosphotrehalase [Arthrobacter sp. JZ12]
MSEQDTLREQPPWWTSAVVYQIYPRSFADSDGDGVGDLGGIINRLDHLADLGVDVLWLSPIYSSPQHDNGYDISDYRQIDPTFGTLEQFDELLAGVHSRGMKLVMDLVVNHTSSDHPWFRESASSTTNPKRDWYWWRDAREGFEPGEKGAEPNNWGSAFSGPAWTLDPNTNQYYLHLFAPEQPDLNWENPEVRSAVYEMMTWWLDRGVDGFRMDVINFISKDPALHDGPVPPGKLWGDGTQYFVSGPRIHEYLQEMHREVFEGRKGDLITVGEMPGVTIDEAKLFTDPARREVDMVFQFEHVGLDHGPGGKWDYKGLDLRDLKTSWNRWQKGLAKTGWNSLYLNNHDQPRLVSRFGDDQQYRYESATLWAAILHLHRGTPYVYQGEEIGMTNVPFDAIEDFRDIESINHYYEATGLLGHDPEEVLRNLRVMSRDNARTPVQWSAEEHAGFTTGAPWIAVNPNYREVNAESDRSADKSVFRFYQRLIELRHKDETVRLGDFSMLAEDHPSLYAFTRNWQGATLLVLGNVSGKDLPVPPELGSGELVLGNYDDGASPDLPPHLRPWEVRILRT